MRWAHAHSADLLVMATRSPRGLDRLFLGSVSEHVLRTAERPVLVVRAEVAAAPAGAMAAAA